MPTTPVLTKHSASIVFMYMKKNASTLRAYNSEGECIWVLQPFEICNFKIFSLIYYKKLSKNGHFNSKIDNFRSMLKKSIFFATDTFIRHETSKTES